MIVDYLVVEPEAALSEMARTRGAHVRFEFLKRYIHISSRELRSLDTMTSMWGSIERVL